MRDGWTQELYADYGSAPKERGWRVFVAKHSPDRFLQPIVAATIEDRTAIEDRTPEA